MQFERQKLRLLMQFERQKLRSTNAVRKTKFPTTNAVRKTKLRLLREGQNLKENDATSGMGGLDFLTRF